MKRLVRSLLRRVGLEVHRVKPGRLEELDMDIYYDVYGKESVDARRFYNIGAGGFRHRAWTNVDMASEWYKGRQAKINVPWDLLSLTPIPVEDNTAEIVYSCHVVEHVTNEAVQNMLNESHRILREGGILRIVFPDIDIAYRACRDDDRYFFNWIDNYSRPSEMQRVHICRPMNSVSIKQVFLFWLASSVSVLHADGAKERIQDEELDALFAEMSYEAALDHITSRCPLDVQKKYPGNHINWFNANKLMSMMRSAGFENIRVSGYGQSFSPVLRNTRLFDGHRPDISGYVEVSK